VEGQSPVSPTSPPALPLSLIPSQLPPPAISPCFTHATVVNHHLLLLHGLEPPTCSRIMCQQRVLQCQPSFTLSSDSSSDDQHAYIQRKPLSTMSTATTVKPMSRKAPILTNGDVTPSIMMEFENACYNFFEAKSVPQEKQVAFILPGIRDLHIRNWITTDHPTIVALPLAYFMSQLCSNYLHPNWEDHVHDEILNSHLDPNKESFWAWSQHVIKLNCLLWDTSSIFDDATLCNQLNTHLNDGLKECIKHSEAKKEKTLKSWINVVHRLDKTHTSKNKHHQELIEETFNKRQNINNNAFHNPSHCNNTSNSNTNSSTSTFTPLPLLLDSE